MANIRVLLSHESISYQAEADILDTPGPLNKWKSRKKEAWGVESGNFTNLLGNGNASGNGILVSWQLKLFDIDIVKVDDTGYGVNNDAEGTFPPGTITWKVIAIF